VQRLEVALEPLLLITIVLTKPRQPIGGVKIEVVPYLVFVEGCVPNDVDLPDFRAVAFLDVDLDTHRVVRSILDGRIDLHAVLAAIVILLPHEHRDIVECRAIERPSLRETDATERLHEILCLDVLVAFDFEALDRWPLFHRNDQCVAIPAHLDVVE
jgi:hypothetical protein